MKKLLAVGVIVLFIGMTISSSTGINLEKQSTMAILDGNTLYVGGSGPGNYSSIQAAVDDTDWGYDTVFVYDDSSPYYENVIIDKNPIKLIGENKETTIIDGSGINDVVLIDGVASGTTVRGFMIRNSGDDIWDDAGIDIHTECNTITGNIIINNSGYGIYCGSNSMPFTDYNIISENIITNNERDGIVLDWSYNNEIYENYVADNKGAGVFVGSSLLPTIIIECSFDEYYNNVYRNTIANNSGCGIEICLSFYTNVFDNNITNNEYGVLMEAPINSECNNNNIYQNNITDNKVGVVISIAIALPFFQKASRAKDNNIYHNNFIGNNYNAGSSDDNIWDNGSAGNYWDNYRGKDEDGDSIGDKPYRIGSFWSGNKDGYPLMVPYGPETAVRITTPLEKHIYLRNIRLRFPLTVVFGDIEIKSSAANYVDDKVEIEKIEFYVDGLHKSTDTEPPYGWLWSSSSYFKLRHTIKVVAFDNHGNSASDEIKVWKFF